MSGIRKQTPCIEKPKRKKNHLHRRFLMMWVLLTGWLFAPDSQAQWLPPCLEPTRVNAFFQCNEPYYNPVCGCDNVTYRNLCVSYNVFGVNWVLSDGVCKQDVFGFDLYPNPSTENVNFSLQFFDQGNMTLQIFDTYGKLMYYAHRPQVRRYDDVIRVAGYKPGFYVVTVLSGNIYRAKKLIVR